MIFLRSISRGPRETSTLRDPYFRRDNAPPSYASRPTDRCARRSSASERQPCASTHPKHESGLLLPSDFARSEERRVGKACRFRRKHVSFLTFYKKQYTSPARPRCLV